MRFEIEKDRSQLMKRMIVASLILHVVALSVFGAATLYRKRPRIKPIRLVPVYTQPRAEVKTVAPKPKPQRVTRPEPVRREPVRTLEAASKKTVIKQEVKPEPKPERKPEPKKIVSKAPKQRKEELKVKEPKKPKATPKQRATPKRRPREERVFKPKPTPARRVASAQKPRATPRVPRPPAPVTSTKGPLTMESLDLPDYYILSARQKIESYFSVPRSKEKRQVECRVIFTIMKDGRIENIRVVKSTGDAMLDQAAVRALTLTKQLGPLPDSISRTSIDTIITFDYSADW
jgi:TonB family protein